MVSATGQVGESMLERAQASASGAGSGISQFGRNVGTAITMSEILDRYYGKRSPTNSNTESFRPDSSFVGDYWFGNT